ncbi:hypothetical protein PHYBOEH_005924 [Phytophthora boehmeriae]|uniref:S-adenosyl-L-methionine-dependent methyltransferase n=1 Tax=Phytophthora boehmeriae TaxID=109152 RepID=A0A8T1WLD6_9STRA|nr:hypothetical protein PHYBOEH_005924 [Phytophthora boehmeriae]
MTSQEPATSSSLFQDDDPVVDDNFAQSMGFVTSYLRAIESTREDRIVNDPFAEPLVRKERPRIEKFMATMANQVHSRPEDLLALRTRFLDEALFHRDPRILQVVILGAGLDTRAYRLESLRGCHVMEVDQSAFMFEHKSDVMKDLHAPQMAMQISCIVSNLAEAGLETSLMGHDFNPTMPTFWVMEGLLPYMERDSIVKLLNAINYLSAPGSELWADIPGRILADTVEWGGRRMKFGEDDPIHGVLSEIPWDLELQVSLEKPGTHFGRKWTPMLSVSSKTAVPYFFVVGKKPIPKAVVMQKMSPGLDFED